MKVQKLSITQAAKQFGFSKETVTRAMHRAGIKTPRGATFPIKTIHNALAGDVRSERARLLREQADKTALENQKTRGELVSIPTMERQLWERIYLPMKSNLETMPERLALLIAPDDAGRVQKLLRDWVEELKASCREPQTK